MSDTAIHVLLVEQRTDAASPCPALDSHTGARITVAATLQEARDCLARLAPDLVIADLHLPDGKGTSLLPEADAEPSFPLLVMTDLEDERQAREAVQAGALDYLVKSETTWADIARIAERALRQWQRLRACKRAEAQLREERDRARQYLDIAQTVLVVLDRTGRIELLNRHGHEVLGYAEGALIGRNWFETCVPRRLRDRARSVFERLISGDLAQAEHYENPLVTKFGEERLFSWHNSFLRDNAGAVVGTLSSGEDITERKKAEKALVASEANWRSLVEHAPDLILTVDRDGRVLFINHTLSGASREEIVGKYMQQFVPEKYHGTLESHLDRVFRTGQPQTFEIRAAEAHGAAWFTNRVSPLKDNDRVVAATIIATDISDRKQLEKALQEACGELERKVDERTTELADSEAKFRTLFESTNDAVMLLDEHGFFECNDATLKVFGCSSREEFVGKHPGDFSPPTQPDGTDSHAAAGAKMALALDTGRATFEWLHCRGNGTRFFADVLLSRMQLKDRTVLQAVVRDISERKRVEEELLRERETLRRLLESSDRDRRLTAYEIHDGLTQHVAGAKMQLEVAAQLRQEDPEAAAKAYRRGVELLSWSMDEARRLISGLRPPILDEAGVVAAIQHLAQDSSAQDGMKINFTFDARFGRLEPLLENAIFRIVQESVTNARRYSQSSEVRIGLTQQGDRVCIEVEDRGIGFDPDDIAETSFGIGGIKERARLLGGQAIVDSKPGKGTLVRVELPL